MLVKGVGLTNTINFVKHKFGEEGLNKILSLVSEETRQIYNSVILANQWYSLDMAIEFWGVMIKEFSEGDESIMIEYGKFVAERNLKGLYRIFVKIGSPEFIISRTAQLIQRYFKGVKAKAWVIAPGKCRAVYEGFEEKYRLQELIILGFGIKGGELSGAKNIRGRLATSLSEGKGYFEHEIEWDK